MVLVIGWRQKAMLPLQRANTLRVRFALWVAGLLFAALLGFGVFVYVWLGNSLHSAFDDALQNSAAQAVAAVNIEHGVLSLSDGVPEASALPALRERQLTLRIIDPSGRVLQAVGPYRDLPVRPVDIANTAGEQLRFTTITPPGERDPVRFYTAPIVEDARVLGLVQVGQSLDTVQDTLNRLFEALLIGVPLLVVVAAVGGYLLAAHALAPIDAMTRTAQRISAADLHARLGLPPTNDEVGRLAATFDGMLARLEGAFERERRFTADASHELRTPLAAMQAILGVTRTQRRTPVEYEQALDDLHAETDRLRGLVEDLLHLARNGRNANEHSEQVDLSTMLNDVAESLAPLAEAKGITLKAHTAPGLVIHGDSDDLIRLWLNLLDNAVKYTERGTILLLAKADGRDLRVEVQDTGIGIAPEHLPRVFERFYRVDTARSSAGSGLGLALAQEIVHAHGGTITITSTPSIGSTVFVTLPRMA